MIQEPIFVVGAPRSGTTFLGRALGLAEGVAYLEESGMFVLDAARRFPVEWARRLTVGGPFRFSAPRHRLLALSDRVRRIDRLRGGVELAVLHRSLRRWNLEPSNPLVEVQQCRLSNSDVEEVEHRVSRYRQIARDEGVDAYLRAYFSDFLKQQEASRLVEKTPDHIEVVPTLLSVFPDARIVLITRDKIQTAASYLVNFDARRNFKNRLRSREQLAREVCRACRHYSAVEDWMKDQKWCHQVEYAEMIRRPEEVIGRLAHELQLNFDEDEIRSLVHPAEPSSHVEQLPSELRDSLASRI